MDTWNPQQYAKFTREREQPFFDLLGLVQPGPLMRVIDLGCGTGTLTRVLHEHLKARETTGLDRSTRMLETARREVSAEGLRFELGEIEHVTPDPKFDVIFSNAALHWLPDHEALLGRLASALAPGGQLAFQVPAMHDTATHRVAEEIARDPTFQPAFVNWRSPLTTLAPEQYARVLYGLGFQQLHVRLVIYPHVLASRRDVVEWTRGTLLTAYEKQLPPDRFLEFLERYRDRLLLQLDAGEPFFFPFKRILVWGRRN